MGTLSKIKKAQLIRDVITERANGMSARAVAKKHSISEQTVRNYCKALKRQESTLPDITPVESITPHVPTIRALALEGLQIGLMCRDDPYKLGALARDALKGIGDFAERSEVTQLSLLVASIPASYVERFKPCIEVAPLDSEAPRDSVVTPTQPELAKPSAPNKLQEASELQLEIQQGLLESQQDPGEGNPPA